MDPSSTHGPCLGVQESIGRDLLLLICTQIIFRSLQPGGAAHAPQLLMPSLLGHYYVLQALVIWMLYLDLFLLVTNPPLYPWDIMQLQPQIRDMAPCLLGSPRDP